VSEFIRQFEEVFDSLLPGQTQTAGPVAPESSLPLEVERAVHRALGLFADGHYAQCWDILAGVEERTSQDSRVVALSAARRSFESGRLVPGIHVCLGLLEGKEHLPDLYLVLGVLLRKAKQRAQAYEAFRQGLRLAPTHPALQARLEDMGLRHSPILPFLPRTHRANRVLGRLRAWLSGPRRIRTAP